MVPFRSRLAAAVVTGCVWGLGVAGPGSRVHAEADVVDAWLSRQADVRSWSADFTQTRTLKTLAQPVTSSGRVWFQAPNRFRWELGMPPQTLAVRGSNQVLILYPLLKRAERYPVDSTAAGPWRHMLALLEAGFPSSRQQLESGFRIAATRREPGQVTVSLEPRSAQARRLMPLFRVRLDPATSALQGTEMTFADGSTLQNSFSNVVENPNIPPDFFEPRLDPETAVTEPLSTPRR